MSITEKELFKLAELSKLDIDSYRLDIDNSRLDIDHSINHKINKLVKDLNNTLELVEQLNNLDTNNIEPMFHPDDLAKQRLRLDMVIENNARDNLQNIAPINRIESGLYLVPKVIDP